MASYKWSHTTLTRAKAKPVKLFKSDAEKNFQRDIDAARTSCSSLTARLAVAELEVSERREDAKRLAVEGAHDGVLDKAEAKLRAAQDRVATLSSALAETKQKITVLEAEQAAAADKKLRSETVAEIDKMALALTGAADDFVFAAAQLATISARISEVAPRPRFLNLPQQRCLLRNPHPRPESSRFVTSAGRTRKENSALSIAGSTLTCHW